MDSPITSKKTPIGCSRGEIAKTDQGLHHAIITAEKMIMIEYHAAYYRFEEDDGWYVVSVLDFPGVNTQGRTLREARLMVKDALRLMVECYLEEGRKLPKPNAKATDRAAKRIERIRLQVHVLHPVPA
jgi:predicted RNase H-like HicB family nuclease